MPYIVLDPDETDAGILGELPDQIRRPMEDDPPLVHIPRPFIGVTAMAPACEVVIPRDEVKTYAAPRKIRRVPRAWWGWIIDPGKYWRLLRARAHRWLQTDNGRDTKELLGGLALFVGFVVIIVAGAVI